MAQIQSFDSSKYDDMSDFTALPSGEYPVQITNSDIKLTKAGTGKYIWLEMTVLNGEFKGRKAFSNLNIENPNPQAVEIAQKELATLCRATNILNLVDTNQLHKIPFIVKLSVKAATAIVMTIR